MKNNIISIIIAFLIWFWLSSFLFNLLSNNSYISESKINKIVTNQNLYCEWWKMFWWEAEDKTWKYCSDFKWLEIKTRRFIHPCE